MYRDVITEVEDHGQKLKDTIMDTLLEADRIEDITVIANDQIEQLKIMAKSIKISRLSSFLQDSEYRYKTKYTQFTEEKGSIAILQ